MNCNQTHTALDQEGKIVFAAALTKDDRGQPYYCVECNQKKYYTHGNTMVHHFRNCSDSTCTCTAESNLHKAIKQLIVDHFGSNIVDEEYSSINITNKINRRADVILHTEIPVIFEIQVSPISQEEVRQRTRDWQSVGFEVVWIPTLSNPSEVFRFESMIKFDNNNIDGFINNLNNYQDFYMDNSVDVSVKCSLDRFDDTIYHTLLRVEMLIKQRLIDEERRKRRIPYDIQKDKLVKIINKRISEGIYVPRFFNYHGSSKDIFDGIIMENKSLRTMIKRAPYIELKRQSNYDWVIGTKFKNYGVSAPVCMDILHAVGTKKARKNPKYLLIKVLDIYTNPE